MQENTAVVSLKNIKNNIVAFRARLSSSVKLYAVVKANAYGHGAERVAESIQNLVDGFVVTSVEEGIRLRVGGAVKEILVLTPPLGEDDVFFAYAHGLSLTVCSLASFRVIAEAVQKLGVSAEVHLKVNTGMNRLGLCGAPFSRLCAALAETEEIRIKGLYSHLYAPALAEEARKQRDCFLRAKEVAEQKFGQITCHLSATGGTLLGENYHFDGIRLGIGMYGYLPDGFESFQGELNLRPAMKLYTHALQSHRFTGGGLGYAVAQQEYDYLTGYRLGYADGFLRSGKALRAVGNLCMDSCLVKGRRNYGERKLVFSSVSALAKRANTIPYEVLCAATKRAEFEYVEC